jgi:hypothetical protein
VPCFFHMRVVRLRSTGWAHGTADPGKPLAGPHRFQPAPGPDTIFHQRMGPPDGLGSSLLRRGGESGPVETASDVLDERGRPRPPLSCRKRKPRKAAEPSMGTVKGHRQGACRGAVCESVCQIIRRGPRPRSKEHSVSTNILSAAPVKRAVGQESVRATDWGGSAK